MTRLWLPKKMKGRIFIPKSSKNPLITIRYQRAVLAENEMRPNQNGNNQMRVEAVVLAENEMRPNQNRLRKRKASSSVLAENEMRPNQNP